MGRLLLKGMRSSSTGSFLNRARSISSCGVLFMCQVACGSSSSGAAPAATSAGGADSAADGALSPDDRAFLERLKQREAARDDLRAHPAKLLKARDPRTSESIWSSYTRVERIEFVNTSGFDVSDIRGSVALRTKDGHELGTVPFQASGFVYSGETAILDVNSNDIGGKGEQVSVVVESVHVWN